MNVIKQLPNVLTSANLATGVLGIINVFAGDPTDTIYFLLIAGLFDFFDGFTARLFGVQGDFGKELDSLADMVTFGVLPALYMYKFAAVRDEPIWVVYGTILIAVFAALRLAKFNLDTSQSDSFVGLNTPANSFMIVTITSVPLLTSFSLFTPILTILSCGMMVMPVRMIALKFKSYKWAGNELKYILLGSCVVGFATIRIEFLPFVIPLYIILSLIGYLTPKNGD